MLGLYRYMDIIAFHGVDFTHKDVHKKVPMDSTVWESTAVFKRALNFRIGWVHQDLEDFETSHSCSLNICLRDTEYENFEPTNFQIRESNADQKQ